MSTNQQKRSLVLSIYVCSLWILCGVISYQFLSNYFKKQLHPADQAQARVTRGDPFSDFFNPKICDPKHPDRKFCPNAAEERNVTICAGQGCCLGLDYCYSLIPDNGQRAMRVFGFSIGGVVLLTLFPIVCCRIMQGSKASNTLRQENKDVKAARQKAKEPDENIGSFVLDLLKEEQGNNGSECSGSGCD